MPINTSFVSIMLCDIERRAVLRLTGDVVVQGGCKVLIQDFCGSPKKPALTLI